MKKYLPLIFLFIFMLVGCGQGTADEEQGRELVEVPFYTGSIMETGSNSLTVSGTSEIYDAEDFVFHISDKTKIATPDGDVLLIDQLKEGDNVEVWLELDEDGFSPIMESYPPQADAIKIVVQ